MPKILIADDELRIRQLVSDFLTQHQFEVVSAEDGQETLTVFEDNTDVDLILLDIMMPEIDGWTVCREIRKTSDVPIIMLTARSQEFDELMGFEAGADDYVTKPFSLSVLLLRIKTLLKRISEKSMIKSTHISLDNLVIDDTAHDVLLDGKKINLTLKEYNILIKLLDNLSQVFTRERLLNVVWGYDYEGDIRTVDSHVARLRTKLGTWGTKHLKTVYGIGYKIEGFNSEN